MPYDPENKNENKNRGPTMRDVALAYYDELGWFPMPAKPKGKQPIVPHAHYGEYRPPWDEIATWDKWATPGANIVVKTGAVSGIVVIDADSASAREYLIQNHHPPCPTVKSGRADGEGLHLYFKHPGFHVKSVANLGGIDKLDIRGDGGIAVLPPSRHESGNKYEWIPDLSPRDLAPPSLPPWLRTLVWKDQEQRKEPVDVDKIFTEGVSQGERDLQIFRFASLMRQVGVPRDAAQIIIKEPARTCNPPFNPVEAIAKVGWTYDQYEDGKRYLVDAVQMVTDYKDDEERTGPRLQPISLADLLRKEFPPTRWAVKNLIPEGSMLFAAKPKLGKSLLMLDVCIAIAAGRKALGHYPAEKGKALFLSLEDPEKRVWERAKARLADEDPDVVASCHLLFESGKLDTGLVADLDEWLRHNPDTRLVAIDTLAKVKGKQGKNAQLYDADYAAVEGITGLSHKHNVAIILITHTNQSREIKDPMELIQGSSGLTGGVDGGMVLLMGRGEAEAYLHVAHKDITSHVEIAMTKDEGDSWLYLGEAEQYRMDSKRKKILALLSDEDGPLSPKEITESLPGEGWKVENVQRMLTRMHGEGIVKNEGKGQYVLGHNAPGITSLNAPVRYEKKEGDEEAF